MSQCICLTLALALALSAAAQDPPPKAKSEPAKKADQPQPNPDAVKKAEQPPPKPDAAKKPDQPAAKPDAPKKPDQPAAKPDTAKKPDQPKPDTAKKPDTPKPPQKRSEKDPTYTDPASAGPDLVFQGEYAGGLPGRQYGVQVIAQGEGEFRVRAYHGGLPGAGWSGDKALVKEWKGKLENNRVVFGDKDGQSTIVGGRMTVMAGGQPLTLIKVRRQSPTQGMLPPPGAVVLYNGTNLDQWTKADGKSPATWEILRNPGGALRVKGGDILSKPKFAGPHTIHIEFMLPFMPRARGQARANSGLYIQNRYELQILDSFGLEGKNNEAGGFYTQHDPKVNMCLPPLQWQTYDIDFTPAKFEGGKKVASARATVRHNGVVVQDNVELKDSTPGGVKEEPTPGGIRLQDHGDPLMFWNIWVVERK